MPETTAIAFEVTPSFEEYLRMNRYVANRAAKPLRIIASMLLCLFLAAPLTLRRIEPRYGIWESYRMAWGVLILPGLIFLLLPIQLYFNAKRQWKSASELRERRRFDVSDAGIAVKGESFQAAIAWNLISRAVSTSQVIILFTNQRNLVYLIPTRAFKEKTRLEDFRILVRRNVANCAGLK